MYVILVRLSAFDVHIYITIVKVKATASTTEVTPCTEHRAGLNGERRPGSGGVAAVIR